jgi:hypothetical protein
MPSPRGTAGGAPPIPLGVELAEFLLRGTPSTDQPLVPGTLLTGKWVGLITGGGGGDALIEAAWRQHRRELLRAASPGKPVAWYWFDAPPGQRRPVGCRADPDEDDPDPDEED